MRSFWDERAREDPFYFVDSRQRYRKPDLSHFFGQGRRDLEAFFGELGVELAPADTVVEIGCGLGRHTRAMARRVSRIVAFDISREMLERAREINPGLDNVRWQLGDGISLRPLEDASADACVSFVVFQHLPDPELTFGYIREIGRVLRPGGWAAIQFSNDPGFHRPRLWPISALRALLGRGPRGYRQPFWLGSAIEVDDLRAAARDGGLEVEVVRGEGTLYCFARLRKVTEP
jgi:SAM-dependent methyltransferase